MTDIKVIAWDFDDLTENIIAAKTFGWQVMHFTEATRDTLEAILPL